MINNYMTININNSIDFKESFISLKNTQFNDLSCHSIHSDVCILNKTNLNDLFNEDIDTLNINSLTISNVNILNKIDDISTNTYVTYNTNSIDASDNFSINNLNIYDTIIDLCDNLSSNNHLQMEKVDISDEIIFKDDVDVSGNIDVNHVFCDSINQLGGMCILYNNSRYYNPTTTTTIINPDFCENETYIDNTIYETSSDETKIKLLKTGYYKCSYSFVFKHPTSGHERRGTRVVPVNEYNSSNPYTYGFTYSYMRRNDGINQSSNHNTFLFEIENPNTYIYFNISLSMNNDDVTENYENDILYTSSINTYKLEITSGNVIFEYLGS
jgi:hypothetical protein